MFGKVDGGWPIAKPVTNTTLAVLTLGKLQQMSPRTLLMHTNSFLMIFQDFLSDATGPRFRTFSRGVAAGAPGVLRPSSWLSDASPRQPTPLLAASAKGR